MDKNKKFGLLSTIFSLILIACIIMVNLGVDSIATRFPLKADLTQNKIYQLSDYTVNMLKALEKEVNVYAFYDASNENASVMEILYRYQRESDKIKLQVVSPSENPALSLKYDDSNDGLASGTIIFDCDGKYTTVTENDMSDYSTYLGYETELYAEEKFTESIIYVTSDIKKKVSVVLGHGEDDGYEMRNVLNQYGYEKQEITLGEGIPEDTSVLMILAPVKDYTARDIEVLDEYLSNGGKLFIAFEPSAKGLDNFTGYLNEWGFDIPDEFALEGDASKIAFNTSLMFYATGVEHPMVGDIFENQYLVLVANTKPVNHFEVDGVATRPVMTTSQNGYIVSADNAETGKPVLKGTVPIAATSEKSDAKIAVFGSNLYFVDALFREADLANKELFLNALEWLNNQKVNTGIRPKSLAGSLLTISEKQSYMIVGVVVALPILIIGFGIYVFIRRKHK